MKDALGHGSNGLGETLKQRLAENAKLYGSQSPIVSSTPKSAPVSIHPSMASLIRAPSVRANDNRTNEQEYNRNLVLRIRNGDIGRRGM
jgi:hypothetical protein